MLRVNAEVGDVGVCPHLLDKRTSAPRAAQVAVRESGLLNQKRLTAAGVAVSPESCIFFLRSVCPSAENLLKKKFTFFFCLLGIETRRTQRVHLLCRSLDILVVGMVMVVVVVVGEWPPVFVLFSSCFVRLSSVVPRILQQVCHRVDHKYATTTSMPGRTTSMPPPKKINICRLLRPLYCS